MRTNIFLPQQPESFTEIDWLMAKTKLISETDELIKHIVQCIKTELRTTDSQAEAVCRPG